MTRRTISSLVALLALAAIAAPAVAMPALTLTPFVGPYVPATRLAWSTSPSLLIGQLEPATMIGTSVGWRWNDRLALEGTLEFGRQELNLISSSQFLNIDAAFVNTDAVVRWTVNHDPERLRWEMLAGAGAYRLRGSFPDLIRASSSPGIRARARLDVVAGLGASWDIGGKTLRIEGRDHMHGGGIEADPGSGLDGFPKYVQHDVSVSLGIGLPI